MNLINTVTLQYPYSFTDLRKDNPNVSFPEDLTGTDLSEYNVAYIEPSDPPPYNVETHKLSSDVILENDIWVQKWTLVELTPEEVERRQPIDWDGYSLYLAAEPAKLSYDLALLSTNPTLSGKLDIAYSQIETKGYSSYLSLFSLYCSEAVVDTADRSMWADTAITYNLPQDFVDSVRGVV